MKNIYLQRMGITTWQLRDQNVDAAVDLPVFFSCMISDRDKKVVGAIFADIDQEASIEAQQMLLEKIAHALAPCVDIKQVESVVEFDFAEFNYVTLLGGHVQELFKNTGFKHQIIQSVSLSELQADVLAKKTLWTQLKPLAL